MTYQKVNRPFLLTLASILVGYTAVVIAYQYPRQAINNLDFWYHISLGQRIISQNASGWVDGLYPVGYPTLLAWSIQLGLDVLRFGQILSWFGGGLLLIATFYWIYQLSQHIIWAFAGAIMLLLNVHFLTHAVYEGNDLLAAGWQAVAVVVLWQAFDRETEMGKRPLLILHGVLLGFAYLTRYTALVLMPVSIIYIGLLTYRIPKQLVNSIGWVVMPFLLITAVQWLPSWIFYQNPLYNLQAKNVWFGIYGDGDWVNNWGNVPDDIGLLDVIVIDPMRFLHHWGEQMRVLFVSASLWPLLLNWLLIIALIVLLFSRKLSLPRRLFLLLLFLLPGSAIALAWLSPRFLLFTMWVELILISWVAFSASQLIDRQRGQVGWGALFLLIGIATQWSSVQGWWQTPIRQEPKMVNAFLRLAGLETAVSVATNDPYLHDTALASRPRYSQSYFSDPAPQSIANLLNAPDSGAWRYLVIDYQDGLGTYGQLKEPLRRAKTELVPLALSDEQDIYCIMPCHLKTNEPLDLLFENGMRLVGYQWYVDDDDYSLYLYWEAVSAIATSYKVSLRIRTEQGVDLVQLDQVPQLWTYPTEAWPLQTPILDFYTGLLPDECATCTVSLVVYDAESGEPVLPLAADQANPLVDIVRFSR